MPIKITSELINRELIVQTLCPICGNNSALIDNVLTMNIQSDKKVELRECLFCRHWWNNPLPSQNLLNNFYQNSSEFVVPKNYPYLISKTPDKDRDKSLKKIFCLSANYSKKISSNNKSFNYLEFGIGSGHMFNFFKQKANISYGIELGEWMFDDKKNIVSKIEQLPNNVKFDMMAVHDVLEHLNNPISILSELGKFASNDCVIHCTFPNKDSLKAKIQKVKWHMIRPFGHLHYFSAQSIKNMFKKSGWKVVKLKSCRISENNIIDLIKQFDWSKNNKLYRLIKSLLLGQIILGKDQWTAVAIRDTKNAV